MSTDTNPTVTPASVASNFSLEEELRRIAATQAATRESRRPNSRRAPKAARPSSDSRWCSKRRYRDKVQATHAMHHLNQASTRERTVVRTYECEYKGWHLTSQHDTISALRRSGHTPRAASVALVDLADRPLTAAPATLALGRAA
ncbi:hypothetical protein [Cellulosimicrobium composti]|uniref:Uncharacterized protein n=1 Tax=Cellulosimicrobium composti TaxID=2672572 RepID=A0ABX0B716_9MICO|nr:hypothetical protein [Cellulosimicrobium composti]NDO88500.1 hypothetical protein [Cellulosimicrobium composti]